MELPNSTVPQKPKAAYATVAQMDYISDLLDRLNADISEYTDTPVNLLTAQEASEIIDTLKDDVTSADAWDD